MSGRRHLRVTRIRPTRNRYALFPTLLVRFYRTTTANDAVTTVPLRKNCTHIL